MLSSVAKQKIIPKRISHVNYQYKDLAQADKFLLDFGLSHIQRTEEQIYYRDYGTETFILCASKGTEDKFGGTGWVVESMEDLELATFLPRATPIQDSDAPGGGKKVTFYDRVENFPFHLVYGQTAVDIAETFPELAYNFPTNKKLTCEQDTTI